MPAGKYVPLLFPILAAACTHRERPSPPGADAPSASASASAASFASSVASPSVASVSVEPVFRPQPAASAAPLPPTEWAWKAYRGDHFAVLFPGDPKVNVLPAEEDKAGFSEAVFEVPGGQVSFAAGFTEHPQAAVAKPDEFLDERINAPRRGLRRPPVNQTMTNGIGRRQPLPVQLIEQRAQRRFLLSHRHGPVNERRPLPVTYP